MLVFICLYFRPKLTLVGIFPFFCILPILGFLRCLGRISCRPSDCSEGSVNDLGRISNLIGSKIFITYKVSAEIYQGIDLGVHVHTEFEAIIFALAFLAASLLTNTLVFPVLFERLSSFSSSNLPAPHQDPSHWRMG